MRNAVELVHNTKGFGVCKFMGKVFNLHWNVYC